MIDIFSKSTAKGHEGEPVPSQVKTALNAFEQMIAFLGMEYPIKLNVSDIESMERDLETIAGIAGQMDSGQRGKGTSFDSIPHSMVRICVVAMRMKLSGSLEYLKNKVVEE